MIVGVAGKSYSGKDTVADFLVREYGFVKVPFALALKQAVMVIFGMTEAQVFADKETVDPYWGVTPREVLQKIGQGLRTFYDSEIWVRAAFRRISDLAATGSKDFVISDVRHPNEVSAIREQGGKVILLRRSSGSKMSESNASHYSETALDGLPVGTFDAVIDNDGTIEDLFAKVKSALF